MPRLRSYGASVLFYGLASYRCNDVIEFYASREEAEAALRRAVEQIPLLEGGLTVIEVAVDISSN